MATKPNDVSILSHIGWNCKYNIVFIPNYRIKDIRVIPHSIVKL